MLKLNYTLMQIKINESMNQSNESMFNLKTPKWVIGLLNQYIIKTSN